MIVNFLNDNNPINLNKCIIITIIITLIMRKNLILIARKFLMKNHNYLRRTFNYKHYYYLSDKFNKCSWWMLSADWSCWTPVLYIPVVTLLLNVCFPTLSLTLCMSKLCCNFRVWDIMLSCIWHPMADSHMYQCSW